ncbi:hypothetical protein [Streptacidiphilus albus]|uniref:hypothetical protein n=1 Tax=Streptacidiphilus albus TaxID=105425 RepID=UPI000691B16B|nr:hypothetical protein [Streptacidiphilus albus]
MHIGYFIHSAETVASDFREYGAIRIQHSGSSEIPAVLVAALQILSRIQGHLLNLSGAGLADCSVVLVKGYDYGPLVPGEALLGRAEIWSNHLLGMCWSSSGATRPMPEWFGDDGADTEAMSETLMDDQAWPVFRVPFDGGHAAIVVYRNLLGDCGIDYLLTHPDWNCAQVLASCDGSWSGPGLTWKNLVRITASPDLTTNGAHDPAERLLLLLPALCQAELPADAQTRVEAALETVGAPNSSIQIMARALLDGRRHSGPGGFSKSPLSGPRLASETGSPEMAMLRALNLTETQHDGLVRALT